MRSTTTALMLGALLAACGSSETTEESPGVESTGVEGASNETTESAQGVEPSGPSLEVAAATPTSVAEAYLRAGSAQNQEDVRANLDPGCHANEAMTRVDAVRVMGVPMTIAELSVEEQSREADRVTVRYSVSGSAHGTGGTMQLFGATVETGEVNVENASQSGTLTIAQIDGRYRVTCGR